MNRKIESIAYRH